MGKEIKSVLADLDEIREVFGLSHAELADLLEQQTHGIPQDRRATIELWADLARTFQKRMVASRIPEVIRTPDAWLGNRTILETLRTDGADPIYVYLSKLLSYNSD